MLLTLMEYKGVCPLNLKKRNVVPEQFAVEKTVQNSVPWNKNRSKPSDFFFEAFHEIKNALMSVC
jgi:hypothetical protein